MAGRRFLARGLDELFVVAVQAGFAVPAVYLTSTSDAESDLAELAIVIAGALLLAAGWFVGGFYEISSNCLGGSAGKRLLRLRLVVDTAGNPPPMGRSVVRWLLVSGGQPLVWGFAALAGGPSPPVTAALLALAAASVLWRGLLAVTILTSGGSGSLHDRVVGTRVVAAASATSVAPGAVAGDADANVAVEGSPG